MWVVYRKSDKQIVGTSIDAGIPRQKNEVLSEVASGLTNRLDPSEYDAVEVTDQQRLPTLLRAVSEGRVRLKETGGKTDVVDDTPEAATIRISTNAQQFHPVDNLPLIPGDGTSFLIVTLQKVSIEQAKDLTRKTVDNEVVWLRTTNGTLREDKDDRAADIRSVTLVSGTAKFRLYSENDKRVATVEMLAANPALRLGGPRVEFIKTGVESPPGSAGGGHTGSFVGIMGAGPRRWGSERHARAGGATQGSTPRQARTRATHSQAQRAPAQ